MTATESPDELTIRPADPGEMTTIADLYLRVRHQNLAVIPPVAHAPEGVRDWFAGVLVHRDEVWVAERAGTIVGFIAWRRPDWVDQLYVDASVAGQGIGSALLDRAVGALGSVQLWTFQANTGARRFYERHGFVAVEQTEGDNEEGAPDVRYLLTTRNLSG